MSEYPSRYGSASTSPAAMQGDTVSAALQQLDETIESCHAALDGLRTKLAPVSLVPPDKATPLGLSAVPGYGIPYVDALQSKLEKLRDLRGRIDDTGARLKL